ncbi:M10 family metallopeptidase C-terminal domain-containing protein [Cognatishimia maritima]|nr:M10 family metallopeptidase C-terminal domain-containing protein [Cognatishimia maritima]
MKVIEAVNDGQPLPDVLGQASWAGITPQAEISESGDAAASTATSASMSVNDTFDGSISSSGDADWVSITLEAGETYVFSAWGTGGYYNGVSDTVLALYDNSGTYVGGNDDAWSGVNSFSQYSFTATSSGTYYIAVSGYGSDTGDYTLQAATNVFTVEQIATQMTEFGWGVNTTLQHDEKAGDTMTVNISALTADGQKLALWALEAWSNVTGITYTTSTSSGADILFDDEASGAFAGPDSYYPTNGNIVQSSVNVSKTWLDYYGTTIDSYAYLAYMHEIGHAMGLMHTGNYNGSATYGSSNHYLNDSYQMSVMSYFSNSENTYVDASNYRPVTPMIADIYAIQSLYGTPTVHAGNTVWGANSNVGGYLGTLFGYMFDGDAVDSSVYGGGAVGLTIYDSGGTDLIDVSTRSENQLVDLRQGGISNIAGQTGNLVIAIGAVIENLSTGSGNDTLIGNAANNVLDAGAGNDTVDGGAGTDTAVIGAGYASVTVTDLGGGVVQIVSADGTDRFTNIEYFQFSDQTVSLATLLGAGSTGPTPDADSITGSASNDVIDSLAGDDTVNGGAGHDTLSGGSGNDRLFGGVGYDRLFGGNDNDRAEGGAGNDLLRGGGGEDALLGQDGSDVLFGDRGNDTLMGGAESDELYGGYQDDILHGGDGDDFLKGELGADTLNGDAGNDTMFGGYQDDVLNGGTGDDFARGGGDKDTLNGEDGADTLFGDRGNDVLNGGTGADQLYGGYQNDVLNGGGGNDLLNGELGADTLNGGIGADSLFGGYQDDVLDGSWGNDLVRGGGDNDTVSGGDGNDAVHGDLGNDEVNGESGNDVLTGGGGNDTLTGGSGNDTMAGGAGSDTFVFADDHGVDRILGFDAGSSQERIDFIEISAITGLSDLLSNHAVQSGSDVVIDTGSGNSITLAGISLSDLDATDFIF